MQLYFQPLVVYGINAFSTESLAVFLLLETDNLAVIH